MRPAAGDAIGLEWGRRHDAAFRLFRAAVRPAYRALPARIRFKDAYFEAVCRVAADSDTRATRPTGGDTRRMMDRPGWPSQSVRGSAHAPAPNVPAATAASTRRFR